MEANYLNRYAVRSGSDTDQRMSPEVELWTEVILQAIDDLDKRTALCSPSNQRSAREWIASDADEIGSFVWACHAINLDPNFIRSQLAKRHQMKNPEEIPASLEDGRIDELTRRLPERRLRIVAVQSRSRPSRSQVFKQVAGMTLT